MIDLVLLAAGLLIGAAWRWRQWRRARAAADDLAATFRMPPDPDAADKRAFAEFCEEQAARHAGFVTVAPGLRPLKPHA